MQFKRLADELFGSGDPQNSGEILWIFVQKLIPNG